MQTGKIGVTTENIFPIIKKYLYSDHEIFLRELVSNAVDATRKLQALGRSGEYKGDITDPLINISLDKDAKTITVSDEGIGMTADEIEKYINQIAFSGASEFMEKYKDASIIGHFGLGFYSSFMVSKKVEIITKSYKQGSQAVKWECDGSPDYSITDIEHEKVGTDIVMFIDTDSEEFLEESRLEQMLKKYCKFLPVRIAFGKQKEWKDGKQVETDKLNIINNTEPAWVKKPVDLKEEDYNNFYHELYPVADEPLFNIHLNVDYPFNLTGILYFPKIKNNIEVSRNKIQLYCNQVFVTDSVEGIVPDYLTLLHGVLDSPDIPLNVSRSYLQSDSNVKKISSHITKKVADRLQDIFKNQREEFEKKWDGLRLFINYGMLTDEKFYDRAKSFALFKNTDGKYFTYEEYDTLIKSGQTDKHGTTIYIYATDVEAQYSFIESAKAKGYDVLVMDGQIDSHFINHLEQKLEKSRFVRVDAEVADKLIEKEEVRKSKLSVEQQDELRPVLKAHLSPSYAVMFENLGEEDLPIHITQSEFMRRMKEMASMNAGMGFYGTLPDSYNLVINTNHPLIAQLANDVTTSVGSSVKAIAEELKPLQKQVDELTKAKKAKKDEEIPVADKEKLESLEKEIETVKAKKDQVLTDYGKDNQMVKQFIDLALISNNMLKGEELSKFVKRSIDLLKK